MLENELKRPCVNISKISLKQYLNANKQYYLPNYSLGKSLGEYKNKQDYITKKTNYILDLKVIDFEISIEVAEVYIRNTIKKALNEV